MSLPHAPSVSYPVGRSRLLARYLVALWLLAAAVTLAWWQQSAPGDPGPSLGLAAWLISGVALWAGWRHLPVGRLAFRAGAWSWQTASMQGEGEVSSLRPVLDLQRLLLIRLQPRGAPACWVWADAANDPGHWLDLRRAVFARPHNPEVAGPASGRDAPP